MKKTSSRLQPRSRLASASLVLVLLTAVQSAFAANQYWDPGFTPTANSGTGSGGSGTWLNATGNWSNGTTDGTLTANNIAVFAGASGGNVALTTLVPGTSSTAIGGLSFTTSNYVIGNGTNTGQITINAQTASDGISVASGVTGTVIDIGGIRLGSVGSGTAVQLTNTDLIDFKNTTIYLSGSRTTKVTNSSASATTTFGKFAVSDKGAGGTWPNAVLSVEVGNVSIGTLASASNNASTGALSAYNGASVVNTTFAGNTTGTLTLAGNNTLFHNANASGQLTLTVNMGNGTLALGHDNALGAVNGSGAATNTAIILQGGTLAASGGARTIANAITIANTSTTKAIGGSNNITFTGTVTNAGVNRTLSITNTANTTIAGNVFLSDAAGTARTLTIGGTGNATISGAIANFNGSGLAGGLTKTGTGILTLSSAANTYTGATTISGGSLALGADNAFSSGSAISLGAGTLDLATFSATAASLDLANASSTLKVDFTNRSINNSAAFLALTGNLTETTDLASYTVDFGGFTFSAPGTYKLLSFTSASGTLFATDFSAANFSLSGVTGSFALNSGDLSYILTSAVPEPSAFAALAGIAGLGLALSRRRRH